MGLDVYSTAVELYSQYYPVNEAIPVEETDKETFRFGPLVKTGIKAAMNGAVKDGIIEEEELETLLSSIDDAVGEINKREKLGAFFNALVTIATPFVTPYIQKWMGEKLHGKD